MRADVSSSSDSTYLLSFQSSSLFMSWSIYSIEYVYFNFFSATKWNFMGLSWTFKNLRKPFVPWLLFYTVFNKWMLGLLCNGEDLVGLQKEAQGSCMVAAAIWLLCYLTLSFLSISSYTHTASKDTWQIWPYLYPSLCEPTKSPACYGTL